MIWSFLIGSLSVAFVGNLQVCRQELGIQGELLGKGSERLAFVVSVSDRNSSLRLWRNE